MRASSYGDPLTFTPEDRPINAVDGNPATAWTFGAHSPVAGTRIQIDLEKPGDDGSRHPPPGPVGPAQPAPHLGDTHASTAGSRSGSARPPRSYRPPGQTVSFPARTFSQLQVTVNSATGGADKRYDGLAQVGFAEIGIPGLQPASEALRLPTDLLSEAGRSLLAAFTDDPHEPGAGHGRAAPPRSRADR